MLWLRNRHSIIHSTDYWVMVEFCSFRWILGFGILLFVCPFLLEKWWTTKWKTKCELLWNDWMNYHNSMWEKASIGNMTKTFRFRFEWFVNAWCLMNYNIELEYSNSNSFPHFVEYQTAIRSEQYCLLRKNSYTLVLEAKWKWTTEWNHSEGMHLTKKRDRWQSK